jgi:hypothetical protein
MLLQITQLTEDDSYEYGDGTEQSDAWINIHLVESVTDDESDENKCYVYMQSQDYFYIDESSDSFIKRYQEALYGTIRSSLIVGGVLVSPQVKSGGFLV